MKYGVGSTFSINERTMSILLVETEAKGWAVLILYDHSKRSNIWLECPTKPLEENRRYGDWVYEEASKLEKRYNKEKNVPSNHNLFQKIKEDFLNAQF